MVFILCACVLLLNFWGTVMLVKHNFYVVFASAVLDLPKFGFCKFISNFLVPVSPIAFS